MTPPLCGRAARATLAALGTLTLEELRLLQVTVAEEVERRLVAPHKPTTMDDAEVDAALIRTERSEEPVVRECQETLALEAGP
jgi:hypothetical protein